MQPRPLVRPQVHRSDGREHRTRLDGGARPQVEAVHRARDRCVDRHRSGRGIDGRERFPRPYGLAVAHRDGGDHRAAGQRGERDSTTRHVDRRAHGPPRIGLPPGVEAAGLGSRDDVGRAEEPTLRDDDLRVTDTGDAADRRQRGLQHRDAAGPARDVDDDRPARTGTRGVGPRDRVPGQLDGPLHERSDHRLELASRQQQRVPGAGQFDDGLRGVGQRFLRRPHPIGQGDRGGRGPEPAREVGVEFGGLVVHPTDHPGVEVPAAEVVVAARPGDGEALGAVADEDRHVARAGAEVEDTHPFATTDVVPAVHVVPSGSE